MVTECAVTPYYRDGKGRLDVSLDKIIRNYLQATSRSLPVSASVRVCRTGRLQPSGLRGVARRPEGDLIVNDYWDHRIWRIDREGTLHLFGGDGIPGDGGDGGPVGEARFREHNDLHQDPVPVDKAYLNPKAMCEAAEQLRTLHSA